MRVNAHAVISEAVENGATLGWRRAFKHTDKPDESTAIESITSAVMNELCEVLEFEHA